MICNKCGKETNSENEYCHKCQIKELSKKIEETPDNDDLFYQRGRAKYELKKYKEAIEDFDKAISIKDYVPKYYFYRGSEEYKNAVSYFSKYLETNPDDIEIQYEKKFAEILAK